MSNEYGQKNNNLRICPEGEQYVKKILAGSSRTAIMACEGACIKGEVARLAANILAYKLERDSSVRICLGDAATGNSGFVDLVKKPSKTIVIEGCFLHCGTEIMKKRIPDFDPIIVEAIRLYSFDRDKYFEIFDLPREQLEQYAQQVADYVQKSKFQGVEIDESIFQPSCCCR